MISLTEIKEHMAETHGSYHGRMHGIPRPIQCENCKATFKTERHKFKFPAKIYLTHIFPSSQNP